MKGVLPGACAGQNRNGDDDPPAHGMDAIDSPGNSEQTLTLLNTQIVLLCFLRRSIGVAWDCANQPPINFMTVTSPRKLASCLLPKAWVNTLCSSTMANS